MNNSNKITFIFMVLLLFGCSKTTNDLYSTKSFELIQQKCEISIRSWINSHAAFPDSYIPLLFEKTKIGSTYDKSAEVLPLRRYSVEHTFEIRTKEYDITH